MEPCRWDHTDGTMHTGLRRRDFVDGTVETALRRWDHVYGTMQTGSRRWDRADGITQTAPRRWNCADGTKHLHRASVCKPFFTLLYNMDSIVRKTSRSESG